MRKHHYNRRTPAWQALRQAALGAILLALATFSPRLPAQITTTTVQGRMYRADGSPATGALLVSWSAFTTAGNQAVAAGNVSTVIGPDGFVTLQLTPNAGATPAGSYYTAVYHLSDGTVNTEYWVVPAAGTASIASVRAQLQPATVAVQSVSQNYVDQAVQSMAGASLPLAGGAMTGPLTLSADPTSASQAATKHYADQLAASNLPLSGGSLSGALSGTSASFSSSIAAGSMVAGTFRGSTDAATWPGPDMCAKIVAALTAGGAGATVDARGLTGRQSCSMNVAATAGNQTLLLSGNLLWNLGSYQIFKSSAYGGLRILGGGRSSGGLGQTPGCALATPVGGGTCIFSSNPVAMVQLGDGSVNYSGRTNYPALHSVVQDLTLIGSSATADGVLLVSEWEDELNNIQEWSMAASSGAAVHEKGVDAPPSCSWGWGLKVYNPDFGGFHRGWFSDGGPVTDACEAVVGTGTLGASQFFGGYVATNMTSGIGLDWSGPQNGSNQVFGTDFENNYVCVHIQQTDNRFYGRCEGSDNVISIQLDGTGGGAGSNTVSGLYAASTVQCINGANCGNNLFDSPYNFTVSPTGNLVQFYNGNDTEQDFMLTAGQTADQNEFILFRNHAFAPVWRMGKGADGAWALTDSLNGQTRLSFTPNGVLSLNTSGAAGANLDLNTGSTGTWRWYGGGGGAVASIDSTGQVYSNTSRIHVQSLASGVNFEVGGNTYLTQGALFIDPGQVLGLTGNNNYGAYIYSPNAANVDVEAKGGVPFRASVLNGGNVQNGSGAVGPPSCSVLPGSALPGDVLTLVTGCGATAGACSSGSSSARATYTGSSWRCEPLP